MGINRAVQKQTLLANHNKISTEVIDLIKLSVVKIGGRPTDCLQIAESIMYGLLDEFTKPGAEAEMFSLVSTGLRRRFFKARGIPEQ